MPEHLPQLLFIAAMAIGMLAAFGAALHRWITVPYDD